MALWKTDPKLLAAGAVVGLGLVVYFRKPIVAQVADVFDRGERLTYAALDELNGIVLDTPSVLQNLVSNRAGFDVPAGVASLARMIRSEGATQGELRAHVAINDLEDLGWSNLHDLLTYSTASWSRGKYGKQHSTVYRTPTGGQTSNRAEAKTENGKPVVIRSQTRRYSTWRDPYMGDVQTAMKVLADRARGIDKADGAVKFVDKSSMGGVQGGTGSFDALVSRWGQEGLVPFTTNEYGDDLVLFKRA